MGVHFSLLSQYLGSVASEKRFDHVTRFVGLQKAILVVILKYDYARALLRDQYCQDDTVATRRATPSPPHLEYPHTSVIQ